MERDGGLATESTEDTEAEFNDQWSVNQEVRGY